MAGPERERARAVLVLLAVVLALAEVVLFAMFGGAGAVEGTGSAVVPSRPAVPLVRQAPAAKAAPIQPVRPSAPVSFKLTGKAFTIKANVCAMANIRPYDPPGEQHHTVCWVRSGFGVAPGSHQTTSFLFGHSWAPDPQEVLNKASELATREILRGHTAQVRSIKPGTGGFTAPSPTTTIYPVHALDGYHLVLRTHTGVLTYQVRTVYGVDKNKLGWIGEFQDESIRNRIVLTTCSELHGTDYDYNVVIEAYLVAARPLT
jgi:hypothetical protein